MKDITLKIIGKQCYDNHEEEQMEFVTDGKLYVRGGAIYIVYDESDVSGLSGCKTTLKVSGDSLKMRRIGGGGPQTELYFEKGKRISSLYETPYGPMELEVLTASSIVWTPRSIAAMWTLSTMSVCPAWQKARTD